MNKKIIHTATKGNLVLGANKLFVDNIKQSLLIFCFFLAFFRESTSQDFQLTPFIDHVIFNSADVRKIPSNVSGVQNNKSSNHDRYLLTIKADFEMEFLMIYHESGEKYFDYNSGKEYRFEVLSGKNQIITIYYDRNIKNQNTIFYKELVVEQDTTITIGLSEANKTKLFKLLRADNSELIINQISFKINLNDKVGGGLLLDHIGIFETEFILDYNQLPVSNSPNEWIAKGKQSYNNGDLYILNGVLSYTDLDSLVQNDPVNFAHANFYYNFPDTSTASDVQVAFSPWSHFFSDDPKYSLPLRISLFQDNSKSLSLTTSKFWHSIGLNGFKNKDMASILIRINKNQVLGFTTPEDYENPIILSNSENVFFGMTPTYWFGKFVNGETEIKIENHWGVYDGIQLFLSQTNDALPQYPPKLIISSDSGIIIEKEILTETFLSFLASYNPDSLRFTVLSKKYTVEIMNDKSEVFHRHAYTKATAEFDLRNEDKNPPNMTSFQLLSNNQITSVFKPGNSNIIYFKIEDDELINEVSLFYTSVDELNWTELPLIYKHSAYIAEIPVLSSNYYSLLISSTDLSGNKINVEMGPAFYYDNATTVIANDNHLSSFKLFGNYPNPFNPITTIKYKLPYKCFVQLIVYDLLGNEIVQLARDIKNAGIHEIEFNGSNLPSGIYFISLTAGKYSQTVKAILLK